MATRIKKVRPKYKGKPRQSNKKKIKIKFTDKSAEEARSNEEKKERQRKYADETEKVRKMFMSTIDPYDTPLTWWETEHVKYAINYPPVRTLLENIMGTHIVRLTDRKYMLHYMSKIQEDNDRLRNIRIEKRKLSPPSIIYQLLQMSYKALIEKLREPGFDKIKLYT